MQAHAAPDLAQFETAIIVEKEQHEQLGTWKLMDLPSCCKAINSLGVFKQKWNNTGEIAWHKTWLVADSLYQISSVNFL